MHILDLVNGAPRVAVGRRTTPRARFVTAMAIAFLLAGVAGSASAENLERLFFSPLERQTLDEARDQGEPPPPDDSREPEEAPPVEVISFDGKVERSDGSSTFWVNGRAVFTGDRTVEGIRMESSPGTAGETQFQLPPSDASSGDGEAPRPFTLKVGQKVAVQNGRKLEAYETRPDEDAESIFREQQAVEESSAESRGQPLPAPAGGAGNAKPASEN